MTEPGEMDELRARLRRVEQDVAAARILAGGADRDVGEIRAELREFREQNTRLHNATRADIVDLRTGLTDLRTDLTDLREHVDRGFAQADQNFLAIRGQLDGVAAFMRMIAARLPEENGDERPPR